MEATYPKKQLNHQQYHQHHPMCCHMNSSIPSPHITTTFSGKPKTGSMTPITQYFLSDHHLQGGTVDNGHYSKDSPSQHQQPLDDNFSWHTQHMSPAVPNYRAAMTSPRQPQMSPSYNAATNFINPRNVNSYGIPYNTTGDLDAQTQYRNDLPDPYRQPKGQLNSPNPGWNSYSIAYTEDLNKNQAFQPKYVASMNHGMPHYNMPQSLVMPNFNSDPNNSTPTLNQLLQAPTFIMQHQTSNMMGHPNRNDLKQSGHSPRFTSNQFNSLNQPINNNPDVKKDFPQFLMESAGHVPQSFPYRPLNSRNPSNHLNDTNSQISHSSNYGSVNFMDQKFMPDDNSNRPGLLYGNENIPQSYAQNLDSHRRSPPHQANPTTPNAGGGDNSNNNDKIGGNPSPPPPANLLNQMLLSSSSTTINNNPSPKTPSQGSSSTLTLEGEETHPHHGPVGQHPPQAATHKRLHKLKRESSVMAAPSSPNSNGGGVSKAPRDYKRRKKGGPGVPPPHSSTGELVTINNYNSAESNSNMSSLTGGASNNSYHQGLNSPAPAFVAVPTSVNASNPPGLLPNTFPSATTSMESGNFVVRNETDSNSFQDASLLSSNGFKYQSQKSSVTPINLSSYSPDQSSSASFKEENSGNLNSPGWLSKSITSPINPSQSPSLSRIDKINHNLRVKKNEPIAKLYDFGSEPERKPFLDHLLQFNEHNANPIPFIPTVSKAYVDLYKLYCMVKERGGILMVNQRKQWREIAAEILDGHSASTSYNLRKQYIKCLLDYECKFEMNGADPAPIITQIELSVKKKKKKVDPSQVSSCSQSIVSPPCTLPFQPTKNNITGLPNPSTPFPSSPALNYMQSHNNNGSNPAGPHNISPPSERIKVRDPFSDENPTSNPAGPGGMYGNFKGMPYNNNMPPSHLSNVGVHPFAKLHPGAENVRTNNDPSPHPSMQPVVYNNNQFHTKPFTPEHQNAKMMMAEHQLQQPYNEFARGNQFFNQSPMQHDIKPPPPGNMLNCPANMPPNMDKRLSEQGLLKGKMPIEHFPTDPLLLKSEIKCEFMSDQRSMEPPPSLQGSEMFYKDPEMGHPLIPQQGGEMPANNFSLQSSNQDFDTYKHSKPKIPDPTQLDYNYRGSRFSSSNLFHDIPPNVAITENSIDPRSLKHTSRSTLPNGISKDPLFPPDSVEAIVPKYVKHKKIHCKDLGNLDLRKIQLALKSGLVSLSVHAIDAFSVLQSEESKLSQFHLSQCQGLLDLLIEYFQASLEVLFHLSRSRKTLINPLETSHPDIVEGCEKEENFSLNLNAKEAKERMRSGKNYTMTTRTKKSVRFKRATPNEIDPLASQSRFEQQVFDDHDDTPFRCPLPCFDRCLVNFRPDLPVVSEKDEIRQQHEPLPDDNPDQEPSLDFALEERDRVIMYDRDAPNLLSVRCVLTLANIFRGLSFVPGNEITLCKNRALLTLASRLLLLSPRHSPAAITTTTAPAVVTQHCSTSWPPPPHHPRINYVLRDCWLTVSKDVMVLLSNVAGKLDLQTLPDDVISDLLNSLVYTLLDPNSLKLVHNLATLHNAPTRKFMALEILCKLSVSDSNMDYILATLSLAHLEQLVSCLIEMLTGKESTETVLKECSLVLLLNLGLGDAATGFVFNLISHVPHSICAIVEFMEEIECNASRVIHTQGFPALRDNPELMGTSLSMLRRSANLLLNLALKTDCKALFFRLQNRLLNLVMSQILDQNVANIIADILHILSANQSDHKET